MAFLPLQFTKSWENPGDFPTYEPDEARVRADLQLLHEETRNWLNALVEQLNDPSAAAQLPFAPGQGLTAQTVQDAIEEVYAAIRNAAAGLLVDGTVSKEKLAVQLLERTYGGRVWVSMDTPGAAHHPGTDFPVGQLWLRPRFTVNNLLGKTWSLSGCTKTDQTNGILLTTTGSQSYIEVRQNLKGLGTAGQKIFLSVSVGQRSDHLSGLTLYLNGLGHDLMGGGGVFETSLDGIGGLDVTIQGQWPYAEANAVVELKNLAAVNAGAIEADLSGCKPLSDWPGLLQSLTPFTTVTLPRQVFLQTRPGQWEQVDHEVLPVSRGGTGVAQLQSGGLLIGNGTGQVKQVAPGSSGSFLRCDGSKPEWVGTDAMIQAMGALRFASGTYTGQADTNTRTVSLPVAPKLIYICSKDSAEEMTAGIVPTERIVLMQGFTSTRAFNFTDSDSKHWDFTSSVQLNGSQLTFTSENRGYIPRYDNRYCNQTGIIYEWAAIY